MSNAFPLTAVVRLRQQTETALERALAAAEGEVIRATLLLSELERGMQQHNESRLQQVGHLLHAAHHQATAAQWAALRRHHADQQRHVANLKAKRQEALEQFLDAKRRRETVETLEKNWQLAQKHRDEKKEQLRLDDLSATRSQRENTAKSAELNRQKLPRSILRTEEDAAIG